MKKISRRNMLAGSGLLGRTLAAALPGLNSAAEPLDGQPSAKRPLKVVVTGGHPGDPEYGCGGTIARYSDLGHEVVLLYLNRGEWPETSAADDKSVRVTEARNACEILKARPAYVGQIDGRAIVDQAHYDQFHRLLEAERPN